MSKDREADDPAMLVNSSILYLPAISHAVINGSFDRDPSLSMFSTFYVNANDTGPFPSPNASQPFIAESKDFYNIIGSEAKLSVVAVDSVQQFHEAGVYVPATNEVFFTSNQLKPSNSSTPKFPIYGNLNKMSLTPDSNGTLPWETVTPSSDSFILPNGGTFYNNKVLMVTQGYELDVASALIAVDPKTLQSEVLLNNFYGRPFNSMNDVAVLFREGGGDTGIEDQWVFFTDPPYGHAQNFKPYPRLPSQVYAFHPPSGTIRVVADGFDRPNGVAFSPDMKTCYITDTGFANGVANDPLALDGSRPGTIYAYDVIHPPTGSDPRSRPPALSNRRVFAFTDSGMPDGIKCDTEGNLYAGCFDGVHVWNQYGALLGKILLGLDLPVTSSTGLIRRGCANLVFVPGGLLMFAEERMYLATIKAKGALLP